MMFQPGRGLAICGLVSDQFQTRIFVRKLPDAPFARWFSQPAREVLGL